MQTALTPLQEFVLAVKETIRDAQDELPPDRFDVFVEICGVLFDKLRGEK